MIKIYILLFSLISVETTAQTINKININGNDRVSSSTVKMFADVAVTEDVNDDDINLILKRLYESNFFDLIKVSLDGNVLKSFFKLDILASMSYNQIFKKCWILFS